MAEDINESWMDIEDVEDNKVVLLQAHIRGHLTRKWMKALQHEFEEMCLNIDCKPIEIEWPRNHLCSPKFINPKQRKVKSSGQEKDLKVSETTKSINQEKTSVEIQTENSDYLSEKHLKIHNDEFVHNQNSPRQNLRINDHTTQVVNKNEVIRVLSNERKVDRLDENPEEFTGTGTVQDPIQVGDKSPQLDFHSQRKFRPISASGDKYSSNVRVIDGDVVPERDIPRTCHTQNTRKVPDSRNNRGGMLSEERPDISSLADTSSVWDIDISSVQGHTEKLPTEKKELTKLRKNLAMELLWIQQAITSRKNYLKLKEQMV